MKAGLRVSIVVPVHGGPAAAAECLAALARLAPPPDEVVVVVDSPGSIVGPGWPDGVIRGEVPWRAGPARARNAGVRLATGAVVLFIDADVVVPPETVGRVRALAIADPGVAAWFGSYDDRPAASGWSSRFRNLLHHYTHQQGSEEASTFWAGLGAVRRDVFHDIGGFDEHYGVPSIEDVELGYRLRSGGHRVRLVKDLQGCHLKRWTLVGMLRTDFARRAVPWTRLTLSGRTLPQDLAVGGRARRSVMLAGMGWAGWMVGALAGMVGAGAWAVIGIGVAGLAWGWVWALNRGFLGFLARQGGMGFAVTGFGLYLLHLTAAGLGAVIGTAGHVLGRR